MAAITNGTIERVPLTIPVSDLRNEQARILEQLGDGPILLTQRGRAAAMLIAPQRWNELIDHLETLEDSVDALLAKIELLVGDDETVAWEEAKVDLNALSDRN
jgi:antitoxin Phd